jgi:molecular chaperone Hsp33
MTSEATRRGDHLVRAIAKEANVRVVATVTTSVAREAAVRHRLAAGPTRALGKALTSGLLLATMTKGQERVTLQLVGDGPIGSLTVDANGEGEVRGYAARPHAVPAAHGAAEMLGRHGVVNVVRDLGLRELYQGQVPLTTGEIDEDVESYLRTSEQIPSALGCEVVLDAGGQVLAAGGVLVQVMPGGEPDAVREVQHALRTGRLEELLRDGERSAAVLAATLFPAAPLELIDAREVAFRCRCSTQRIHDMLRMLGVVDLDEMIAADEPAEVLCNFCNTAYHVDKEQLEAIRDERAGGPRESN